MVNFIWIVLLVMALLTALVQGNSEALAISVTVSAKTAVELALGLVGALTLWMGLMRIAEEAGLVQLLAKGINKLINPLFPEVPADHPARGAMVFNMAANMLGLGNAATPMGIKAMQHLQTLNQKKDTATNAMCTFLAINTSSIQLIPTAAIATLVAAGGKNPTIIIIPALLATTCSTLAAIVAVKLLETRG